MTQRVDWFAFLSAPAFLGETVVLGGALGIASQGDSGPGPAGEIGAAKGGNSGALGFDAFCLHPLRFPLRSNRL